MAITWKHSADSPIKLSDLYTTQTQTREVRWAACFSGHWVVTSMRTSHRQLKKTSNGRSYQVNQYWSYKPQSNFNPTWILFEYFNLINSLGPSIQYITLRVYYTGGFNAMNFLGYQSRASRWRPRASLRLDVSIDIFEWSVWVEKKCLINGSVSVPNGIIYGQIQQVFSVTCQHCIVV